MWGALTGSASRARSEALSVYRALLRGAKAFPSVKRQAIYEEIREEYRSKASVTDPAEIETLRETARQSLQQMRALNRFVPGAPKFELTLDPPMSRPLKKAH